MEYSSAPADGSPTCNYRLQPRDDLGPLAAEALESRSFRDTGHPAAL